MSWNGDRGWVSAAYLNYLYNNQYVYLPDYVADVPVVTFALNTYWGDYYPGRPWYGRLAYWRNLWRAHGRYGFLRHEPGTNAEHIRQAQGERFRNQHEAGNGQANNFRHEPGTNAERIGQAQQRERFRNQHEAGNGQPTTS